MVIKLSQHNRQRAAVSEASVSEIERRFKFKDQSDIAKTLTTLLWERTLGQALELAWLSAVLVIQKYDKPNTLFQLLYCLQLCS